MSLSSVSRLRMLRLHFDTLRYTQPRQLLYRLRRLIQRRCSWLGRRVRANSQVPEAEPYPSSTLLMGLCCTVPVATHQERAEAALARRFTFLNRTLTYQGSIQWQEPRQARLWRFHLHYFDYAIGLGLAFRATSDPRYWEGFKALVDDWITSNPPLQGDGWHPYTVSLRVVNWIRAYHLFERPFADVPAFRQRFLRSLYAQTQHLAGDLEYDVTGNHLIKNGKALMFAGGFFRGVRATGWFERGLRLLLEESTEQVLDDGGHYERSPLYHVQVLADYLDVLPFIPRTRRGHAELVAVVRRMRDFLKAIVHPDGTLPLFNDSVLCPEPSPARLLEHAEALIGAPSAAASADAGVQAFPDSGYYVFRAGDHFVILDCGPVCPDHLPPHAHCDLLSFELDAGGQRLITNSGTYLYEAGPWRDAFRGTAAHNTVQVDAEEQSAIWSSFRVGRRARVLEAVIRQLEPGPHFRGRYLGFEGNRLEHRRELFLLPGPCWVFVDTVKARRGSVPQVVTSRLHCHPQAEVTTTSKEVRIRRGSTSLRLLPIGAAAVALEPGWFSPALGVKEPSPVLALRVQGRLPLRLGFVIAPGDLAVRITASKMGPNGWQLKLMCQDQGFQLGGPGCVGNIKVE
jgi:uncharacterized heparinase superfamily protein